MNLQKKDAINKFPLFISNINENENKKEEDKNSHSIDDLFKKIIKIILIYSILLMIKKEFLI